MNTPKPCINCKYCKWNCMAEENPSDSAYCIADVKSSPKWGDKKCPAYKADEEFNVALICGV